MPKGSPEASVSVVVPALNEERHVGNLLSDLERQTRRPQEVILVDAGSEDNTVAVAQGFAGVRVLHGERPVARGRNLGGLSASGHVLVFFDADVRLPETFLERFLEEFFWRRLDVACPLYKPHESTPAVERFHEVFNLATRTFQRVLPSGAGICLAVRGDLFRGSSGFDPSLKFDDIEFIRRISRGRRFGIVGEPVFVSDRRYREHGVARAILEYALMALIFALGRFRWANRFDYEFGEHAPPGERPGVRPRPESEDSNRTLCSRVGWPSSRDGPVHSLHVGVPPGP
jgi:glycosyltransferase involved in cell wall biosynthesis